MNEPDRPSLTPEDVEKIRGIAEKHTAPLQSIFPDQTTRELFLIYYTNEMTHHPAFIGSTDDPLKADEQAEALTIALKTLRDNKVDLLLKQYPNHGAVHRLNADLLIAATEFSAKRDIEGSTERFIVKWERQLNARIGQLNGLSGLRSPF